MNDEIRKKHAEDMCVFSEQEQKIEYSQLSIAEVDQLFRELDAEKGKGLNNLAQEVHALAVEKGWWQGGRSFGDQVSNFHAEISEAWEDYRNGRRFTEINFEENGKPVGLPTELADLIIRVLDTCAAYNIDIEEAIKIKHEYNKTRPFQHGGKKA